MAHKRPLTRLNGLTELEARFVELRSANANTPDYQLCKAAGYKGSTASLRLRATKLLARPQIRAALKALEGLPPVTKENILRGLNEIFHNKNTPSAQRVAASRVMLETIPGAFVPMQVDHTGKFTLETWVEAMGGRPLDAPKDPPQLEAEIVGREDRELAPKTRESKSEARRTEGDLQ